MASIQESLPRPSQTSTFSEPNLDEVWTRQLAEHHDIQILDWKEGSTCWEESHIEDVQDLAAASEVIKVCLYLIEQLSKETLELFPTISREFFRSHYLNVLQPDHSAHSSTTYYCKWFRRVYQTIDQWQIEQRIAHGRPYNSHLATDPDEIGLDHLRYERPLGICRPYCSLQSKPRMVGQQLRHAAGECISMRFEKVDDCLVGILIFDAVRQIKIAKKEFRFGIPKMAKDSDTSTHACFTDFVPSRQRFRQQLEDISQPVPSYECPQDELLDIVLQMSLSDRIDIIYDLQESLDEIDESLSDDKSLRENLQHWRELLGSWKKVLSNDIISIEHVIKRVALRDEDEHNVSTASARSAVIDRFQIVAQRLSLLRIRAAATFQDIMQTMAIVESQKAIVQAESVSKLTNLAFFFIPLTFIATVLGMNIKQWEDKIQTWIWVATSVVLMALTYLTRYFTEVKLAVSGGADELNTLSLNKTAMSINRSVLNRQVRGLLLFATSFPLLIALAVVLDSRYKLVLSVFAFLCCFWVSRLLIDIDLYYHWYQTDRKRLKRILRQRIVFFLFTFTVFGISSWVVLTHTSLPHPEQIKIVLGMLAIVIYLFVNSARSHVIFELRDMERFVVAIYAAFMIFIFTGSYGIVRRDKLSLAGKVDACFALIVIGFVLATSWLLVYSENMSRKRHQLQNRQQP